MRRAHAHDIRETVVNPSIYRWTSVRIDSNALWEGSCCPKVWLRPGRPSARKYGTPLCPQPRQTSSTAFSGCQQGGSVRLGESAWFFSDKYAFWKIERSV